MYYIYHIPGVKIGCSIQPKRRVKKQKYEKYEVLEIHSCIYKASNREIELQKQYGYAVDVIPYFKTIKIATKDTSIKGGKLSGKLAVESGHLKSICSSGGKIGGKKHVESGHLKSISMKGSLIAREILKEKLSKSILVFDMNNNFIGNFKSIKETSVNLSLHSSNIINVLKGRRTHTKGYTFKYA